MNEEKVISKFTDEDFLMILASKLKCNIPHSRNFVQNFIDTVTKCVVENEVLHIRGFGMFSLRKKKSARIKNFKGESSVVPGYWMIKFTPSMSLKQKVDTQKKLKDNQPRGF